MTTLTQGNTMIYPMFAMVLLTFSVAFYMFRLRVKAVKSGEIKLSYFRLNSGAEVSAAMQQATRNYSNLFEVPVLFYAAGASALALNINNAAIIVIGWLFVITRIAHSWVHLTSNNVIHRLKAFMAGNLCVLVLWILIVLDYSFR